MINNDNRTWYSFNSQTKSYNICEYYQIHMSLLIVVLFLFSLVSMPGFVPHYSKLLIVLGVVLLVLRSTLVLYRNVCIVSCGSRVTFCITCFTRLTRFTRLTCITSFCLPSFHQHGVRISLIRWRFHSVAAWMVRQGVQHSLAGLG